MEAVRKLVEADNIKLSTAKTIAYTAFPGSKYSQYKGTSEYKNHAEFKRNRLVVIKNNNSKCVNCGADFKCVHHIDYSKDNHALSNLIPLCNKCHRLLHSMKKHKLNGGAYSDKL